MFSDRLAILGSEISMLLRDFTKAEGVIISHVYVDATYFNNAANKLTNVSYAVQPGVEMPEITAPDSITEDDL